MKKTRRSLRSARQRSSASTVVVSAAAAASSSDPSKVKVVGVGSAGVDYLASIASFPEPDAKLRTDALEIQGGGNAGNALTAMSRLGVKPSILTKLSDDGAGKAILDEFAADGVDASAVVIEAGKSSPFTYIIVDRAGSTRTCIHTPGKKGTSLHPTPRIHALAVPNHQSTSDRIVPLTKYATPDQPPNTPTISLTSRPPLPSEWTLIPGPEFTPEEMPHDAIVSLLEGASLLYFDGRLTEVRRRGSMPRTRHLRDSRPLAHNRPLERRYECAFYSCFISQGSKGSKSFGIAVLVRLPRDYPRPA